MKNLKTCIFKNNVKSIKKGIMRRFLAFMLASCMMCTSCGATGGDGDTLNRANAAEMRLRKLEGTISVADGDGKEISPRERMGLYSGYGIDTAEKSYAWITLDSAKLTKMDEESRIKIEKEGKKLRLQVDSGKLFFNVAEPLKDDESMEIRTSTMGIGLRGTSGWVYAADETHMYIYILEGTVQCSITDPESDETAEMEVSGGETAVLSLNPEAEAGSRCEIDKEAFSVYDIPLFIMRELLEDEKLRGKITAATDMELPSDSTPESYMDIGEGYIGNGNGEDAIDILNMALEEDSTLSRAYALRGDAYIIIGETKENLEAARTDYETALGIEQGTPGAYLGIADIHIRKGEYGKALDVLKEGLEKSGNDQKITDKIAEFESGNITDSQKKPRRYSAYDEGRNLKWYHEYAYDEMGRESRVISYDAAGAQTSAVDILYDEQGRPIQGKGWTDNDGVLSKVVWQYDEAGQAVRYEDYNPDGTLGGYRTYEYEDKRETMRCYNADGTLNMINVYTKDDSGRTIKDEVFSPDGTLTNYAIHEYDARGYNIKRSYYFSDGRLSSYTTFEYDDDGNCISEQQFNMMQ